MELDLVAPAEGAAEKAEPAEQIVTVVENREPEEESDPRTEEAIEAIEDGAGPTALVIDGLPLTAADAKRICKAIKSRASKSPITSIAIQDTALYDFGADKLAEVLKATTSVTSLSLIRCNIGAAGGASLAKALQEANSQIATLDLSENNLRDAGAQKIARSLEKNTALRTLKLCFNQIGEMGCARLCLAMGEGAPEFVRPANAPPGRKVKPQTVINANKTLADLDLEGNAIGRHGAESLANMLSLSTSLKSLNVSECDITDFGAVGISNAMKKNSSLTDLSFASNGLTQYSAIRIANMLESNKSLVFLDMLDNDLGHSGVTSLREALDKNTTLMELLRPAA